MNGILIRKTGATDVTSSSDGRLTLSVPIQFKRRGGRKQVTLPDCAVGQPRPWDTAATALQLALARGHRWLAMLESGEAKSLREIAALEGVDNSYVSRMVNLSSLDDMTSVAPVLRMRIPLMPSPLPCPQHFPDAVPAPSARCRWRAGATRGPWATRSPFRPAV